MSAEDQEMSVATEHLTSAPPAGSWPSWRRFTVEQYHRLIDAGVLDHGEPVELLEGWVVEKMTRKPIHDAIIQQLIASAAGWCPTGWSVRPRCAITTLRSEPEPDLAVVRGAAKVYRDRHPTPADVALIVEVADSSLTIDRDWKRLIYADAGIAHYWIINVVAWKVEAFSDPTGSGESAAYRKSASLGPGDFVEADIESHVVRLPVDELFLA